MKSIILIGPMRSGKTTVARLLADQLDMPHLWLDGMRGDLYPDFGYDADHARTLSDEDWLNYQKPFELKLVAYVLKHSPEDHILDLGAGHSVYTDEDQFQQLQQLLKPFPYVIHIRPCEDDDEAIKILNQRDIDDGESGLPAFNSLFVKHPSNTTLATHTIYNQTQSPQETADQITAIIQAHN